MKLNLGAEDTITEKIPQKKEETKNPIFKRSFENLANPCRVREGYNPVRNKVFSEASEDDDVTEVDVDDVLDALSNNEGSYYEDSNYYDENEDEGSFIDEPPRQSDEEIKKELLRRLYHMQKSGEVIPKRVNMNMSKEEIEQIYGDVQHERRARTSIKFYKQIYYFLTWSIENAALKFGKGKIRLSEWSDSVAANMDTYDSIFEDIYYEHEDILGSMDPILKLGIVTITSAFVYHCNAPEMEQDDDVLVQSLLDRIEQNPLLLKTLSERFQGTFHHEEVTPRSIPITPKTPPSTPVYYSTRLPQAPDAIELPPPNFRNTPELRRTPSLGSLRTSVGSTIESSTTPPPEIQEPETKTITITASPKKKSTRKKTNVKKKDETIVEL